MTTWANEIPPRCTGISTALDLLGRHGGVVFLGEAVSVLDHSLQAAAAARQAYAPPSLIGAALLHDIGHLLHDPRDEQAEEAFSHEELGAGWLSTIFGPEVCEPIRLHVMAKRYLCAVEPVYLTKLTSGSLHSLVAQGGVLNPVEAELFEQRPFAEESVDLRRWDDAAKDPQGRVPGLDSYRALLTTLAANHS